MASMWDGPKFSISVRAAVTALSPLVCNDQVRAISLTLDLVE